MIDDEVRCGERGLPVGGPDVHVVDVDHAHQLGVGA